MVLEKLKKVEDKIFEFIDKYKFIIFFILITVLSLLVRIVSINFESMDYKNFLEPWFNELKEYGGFKALNRDIGNYNAPYMTILAFLTYLPIKPIISIKAVSIVFDYLCAFAVVKIVKIILKDNKDENYISLILYGIIIFLPTIVLNGACWGQADSIYVAFILFSIKCLLEEKYIKSFILLGISFAFKLQFMFILPLYILIYISKRKFSILNFLIIPLMNVIMCIPAIIFGKSISSCMNVYINQASLNSDKLNMNFPNIYNIFFELNGRNFTYAPNEFISKIGIGITIFLFIIIAFAVLYKKIEFDNRKIIEFGLWSVMIATFFLPHMHDRYLFIGDILSLVYVIYNKKRFYIPIGIELISLYCYCYFLFGRNLNIPIQYISILYLILLVILSNDMYNKYFSIRNHIKKEEEGKI